MSAKPFHIHVYGPQAPSAASDRGRASEPFSTERAEEPALGVRESAALAGDGNTARHGAHPLDSDFESAQQRLREQIPATLLEPDGSLAWAGADFQIVGMIYDAAETIQYIELRGHCRGRQLRQLIETVAGTPRIEQFSVMVLPDRQWKIFQSFERSYLDG